MKKLFPGYFKKTDEEIRKIWQKGVIIFDANVLLNLYRYSDATRQTLVELISRFSKQIYLPHQAALEYNRNRYEVIAEQEKTYKEFLAKIIQIQKDLQSTSKPPFLTAKIDNDLKEIFAKVNLEVDLSIKKYSDYLMKDPIYNKLSDLFDSKITDKYNDETLEEIFKEGEKRFKLKIPPGFEDEKTKEGNKKYGDLVLWKQIIDLAKKINKDIILVSDERKSDWWWKLKDGRILGPRQELIEEMKNEANVEFHLYSSERFLSYGQTFLNEKINEKALDEINSMKEVQQENLKYYRYLHNSIIGKDLIKKTDKIEERIKEINEKLSKLNTFQQHPDKDSKDYNLKQFFYDSENFQKSKLNEEKEFLIKKLESYQNYNQEINQISDNSSIRLLELINKLKD